MRRPSPIHHRIAVAAAIVAAAYAILQWQPGMPEAFVRHAVTRAAPSSQTQDVPFTVAQPIRCFHVHCPLRGSANDLRIGISGDNGLELLANLPVRPGDTRFTCGDGVPAGDYVLHVAERDVTGSYTIQVGPGPNVTTWQKALGLLALVWGLSGIWYLYAGYCVRRGRAVRWFSSARAIFIAASLLGFLLPAYLLAHEGGHSLAAAAFGAFEPARSDFFGLAGSPHAGLRVDAPLAGWQMGVISVSGPLLPTLVGWALFAGWRSARGRAIRCARPVLDLLWSFTTAGMLIGQFGCIIPIIGLGYDGDYSGLVDNVSIERWLINGVLLALGAVNAYLLWRLAPHLLVLRRALGASLSAPAGALSHPAEK